jgi:ABC-type amino acid transport substrate-binding protein
MSVGALVALLILTGCGDGGAVEEPQATPTPAPQSGNPSPAPTVALPEGASLAARVRARGFLRVGVRYDLEPFGYVTDEGELAGFDVDMGRALAQRWFGDPEAVEFRQVRSDTAVEHLQAGDVDVVLAALIHTQGREAGVDFSLPYFDDGHALLVRAVDANAIRAPAHLEGRPVGLVPWHEVEEPLAAAVPFTLTTKSYDRFDVMVDALAREEIDAAADLRRRLFWGLRLMPDGVIVGQYTSAPVAIAFPQNEPFFADLVNLTFQQMVSDGTYATLYARWFAVEGPRSVERWPGDAVPQLNEAPMTVTTPDTIAAIQARRRLAVAMVNDRSPFAYVDASGTPAGFEVNLVRLIAERWLADPAAVDFTPVTEEAGLEMVRTGQADLLIGALPHTQAAEMAVDFSLTTYLAGEGLMIRAGSPVTDLTDLAGQPVATVEGSGSREVLLRVAQQQDLAVTAMPQPSLEAAMTALGEGRVAAIAGERAEMLGPAYATPGLGVLSLRLTQVPTALVLPPGDSAFRDLVNLTLQTMKREGQFDALYANWFDDAAPPMESWPGAPYRALRLQLAPPTPEGGEG